MSNNILKINAVLIALLAVIVFSGRAIAEKVSAAELVNNAANYDQKEITLEGEAVGEVMLRGDYGWVNVSNQGVAIGIWASQEQLSLIKQPGNYRFTGDTVEVTGKFNRACSEHGGDLDIHAVEIIKKTEATPREIKFSTQKRDLAIALLGALGILWILILLKKK